MNIIAVLDNVLQQLHELKATNAELQQQVAQLQAHVELLEHKVDTVAEEMGMI